jgi:hypothetical protein
MTPYWSTGTVAAERFVLLGLRHACRACAVQIESSEYGSNASNFVVYCCSLNNSQFRLGRQLLNTQQKGDAHGTDERVCTTFPRVPIARIAISKKKKTWTTGSQLLRLTTEDPFLQ